jgi:hypothetical protein
MKRHAASLLLGLALVCITTSAFADHQFDISIEGPWILYEFKQFDGTNSMLVAIAPNVPGHYAPVFTTGDGASIPIGIYCVALVGNTFPGTCTPNGKALPTTGTYPQFTPLQVKVYGGSIPWDNIGSSARAVILPIPDSISNDGVDPTLTFRTDFSTTSVNLTPSAIGVQLHYSSGPAQFSLLSCTVPPTGAPSPANCPANPNPPVIQTNSGTLRIAMKAEEHSDASDPCDYHVRMAHHAMLTTLDPTPLALGHNRNQNIAYMEHTSDSASCRACDPQQDSIPSSCAYGPGYGHAQMNNPPRSPKNSQMHYTSDDVSIPDLGAQLSSFNTLFKQLTLILALDGKKDSRLNPSGKNKNVTKDSRSSSSDDHSCPALDDPALDLRGKFPTLSQLACVELDLENSARILESGTCANKNSATNGNVDLRCDDGRNSALMQVRGLLSEVWRADRSGTSGKDCRAAIMMIK